MNARQRGQCRGDGRIAGDQEVAWTDAWRVLPTKGKQAPTEGKQAPGGACAVARRVWLASLLLMASLALGACASVNPVGFQDSGDWQPGLDVDLPHTGTNVGIGTGGPLTVASENLTADGIDREASGPAGLTTARAEMLAQAEKAYQAQDWDLALRLFLQAVDGQTADPHAFLRIGNIYHRHQDWVSALNAYSQAARNSAPQPRAQRLLRTKAVHNIVLVGIEVVQAGLNGLRALESSAHEDPADARALADAIEALAAEAGRIAAAFGPEERSAFPDVPAAPLSPASAVSPGVRMEAGSQQSSSRVEYFRGQPPVEDRPQP